MSANLIDLAKQGNTDAISTLINAQLQSQGITAKVALENSCVYVLLESATVPNQNAIAKFIFRGMMRLSIETADTLQVYGKQTTEKRPSWSQLYSLREAKSSIADKDVATNEKLSDQVKNLAEITPDESLDTIANHLNHLLKDEKINIKILPEEKLLKVIAETNQFLNGSVFAERIYKELKKFDLSKFETVGIYKQKIKSSQCFQIQAFVLNSSENEISEPKELKIPTTKTQGVATTSQKATKQQQSQKAAKPKIRIGRVLGMVGILVVAGFVVTRLVKRLLILVFLSPALGSFSVLMGVFFLWRSYPFLNFLFQKFLSLLAEA